MFGGLAFLVHGNMSVGIHGNELVVRIDPEETEAVLQEPGARLFGDHRSCDEHLALALAPAG